MLYTLITIDPNGDLHERLCTQAIIRDATLIVFYRDTQEWDEVPLTTVVGLTPVEWDEVPLRWL